MAPGTPKKLAQAKCLLRFHGPTVKCNSTNSRKITEAPDLSSLATSSLTDENRTLVILNLGTKNFEAKSPTRWAPTNHLEVGLWLHLKGFCFYPSYPFFRPSMTCSARLVKLHAHLFFCLSPQSRVTKIWFDIQDWNLNRWKYWKYHPESKQRYLLNFAIFMGDVGPYFFSFLQLKIQSSMLQTPHVYTLHLVGIWRNPLPCLGTGLPSFQASHSPNASIFKPSNGWLACSKKEIRRFETGKKHKFCHCLANRMSSFLFVTGKRYGVW